MARVLSRVLAGVTLALVAAASTHAQPAQAAQDDPPPFVAVGHHPTQGTPVPGGELTADLGTWTSVPDSYEFQWLRDGAPIAGATAQDYLVQVSDIGHQLQPHVVGHSGADTADFLGTALLARKIGATLRLDVRRVHPSPTKHRLVWTAITFMTTERPAATDGATVTAYRKKGDRLKPLGTAPMTRGAAFVRLPWKRVPHGRTKVMVCFAGSDAVATSCSSFDVVHGRRPVRR